MSEEFENYIDAMDVKIFQLTSGKKIAGKVVSSTDDFVRISGVFEILEGGPEKIQYLNPYVAKCIKQVVTVYYHGIDCELEASYQFKKIYSDGILMMDMKDVLTPQEYDDVMKKIEEDMMNKLDTHSFGGSSGKPPIPGEDDPLIDPNFLRDNFPGRN